MKRPAFFYLILLLLLIILNCRYTFGADPEQRTATVGDTIRVDNATVHTFTTPGTPRVYLPSGPDVVYTVTATTQPTPPTPPVDPEPTPDPVPDPSDNRPVVRVTSGTGTINVRSNTRYVAAVKGVVVRGNDGILISTGTVNSSVEGIEFIGNGDKGDGIRAITRGFKNVTIADCAFANFRAGATIHHPGLGSGKIPLSEYAKNLTLLRPRFMDMAGKGVKEGHGGYFDQIDGLTIIEPFVDGAGFAKRNRDIFTHGFYIQAGCRRVQIERPFMSRCESVGIQARGPLVIWNDPDDGDPGPVITGGLFDDCAIAIMVNGPRAEVRNNSVAVGHPHTTGSKSGWGGIYASVAALKMTGNARVKGKASTQPGSIITAWLNNSRSDAAWGWRATTNTVESSGNVDRLSVTVDLSDLVSLARSGHPIAGLVAEGRARIAKAVN